jgi:hypothetical protein
MHKLIFRRDEDFQTEPKTGSLKKIVDRKRKDLAPFISFFNEDEKTKIVNEIFNHDTRQFSSFMSKLNHQLTWHDAYLCIDKELNKLNIDIFSNKALDLTDRIYKVFFPEDI